jgi:hypothetical protein
MDGMPPLTYLHISGTLAENLVYRPRPGYESTRPGRRIEGNPAFQLVLLDHEHRVLVSVTPEVVARGCGLVDDPIRFRVRGALPLHPDGKSYELRRGEIRLHAVTIPPDPPVVTAPQCRTSDDKLTLHWQAAPDKITTYSVVAAMESGRRITIARGLTESAYTVDLSQIPTPGKGRLFIVASDGVRSSEVDASSIEVPARPATVHILAPAAHARLPFGQPVSVLGCCLDMEGKPCGQELAVWSLDGERFAAGSAVAAINRAQPGIHRLTLAYGSEADRVESAVSIEIEEPDADYRLWEELMKAAHDVSMEGE